MAGESHKHVGAVIDGLQPKRSIGDVSAASACRKTGDVAKANSVTNPTAATGVEPMAEAEPHDWYGPCDGFGPYGECSICTTRDREFEVAFNFLGWAHWSLGVHFDPQHPHVQIHVPGGYLRIGWYSIKVSNRRLQRQGRPKYTRLIGGNPFRNP